MDLIFAAAGEEEGAGRGAIGSGEAGEFAGEVLETEVDAEGFGVGFEEVCCGLDVFWGCYRGDCVGWEGRGGHSLCLGDRRGAWGLR